MALSNEHEVLRSIFYQNIKNQKDFSIGDEENYETVVCGKAYADFSPRTISGTCKENIKEVLINLANKIYDYIHGKKRDTQDDFDQWHGKICDKFVDEYNNKSGSETKINYGKAQKIVNMTLKYVYCFKDTEELKLKDKFKYCHMALDTYTLDWFSDKVRKWYEEEKGVTLPKKSDMPSWSNLKKGEIKAGEKPQNYTYVEIQEIIRTYLKECKDHPYRTEKGSLTPFEAEFYIWEEQKLLKIRNALKRYESESFLRYRDEQICGIVEEIIGICNTIQEHCGETDFQTKDEYVS